MGHFIKHDNIEIEKIIRFSSDLLIQQDWQ